jgi:hypothetical protein
LASHGLYDTFIIRDNVTSFVYKDRNCEVNSNNFWISTSATDKGHFVQTVIDNQCFLTHYFLAQSTLAIWDSNGNFKKSDFDDIIYDIKDGLR